MKDRVIRIMEHEGMSPSRFAETIGIQRAAMSHIISGRNNPSLDVISKVLERFPHIDSDWLLFGKGEMLKQDVRKEPGLFENPSLFATESPATPEYRREMASKAPINEAKPTVIEKVVMQEKPAKTITKIMVFYSDNTYDTFVLDKNK